MIRTAPLLLWHGRNDIWDCHGIRAIPKPRQKSVGEERDRISDGIATVYFLPYQPLSVFYGNINGRENTEAYDAVPFAIIAADGILNYCSFDNDCGNWIAEWITETKYLAPRNHPHMDYLAYTMTSGRNQSY